MKITFKFFKQQCEYNKLITTFSMPFKIPNVFEYVYGTQ